MGYPRNVLEYLHDTAAAHPAHPALVEEKCTMTFAMLLQRAQAIGTALCGVVDGSNQPVVVLVDRTADGAAALLGVLESGNYYVPLDSRMPLERLAGILQQLQPAALLYAEKDEKAATPFASVCPLLQIEQAAQTVPDSAQLAARRNTVLDADPAYIIFTSGSTGVPKGIVVSHRALIDFTEWITQSCGIMGADRLANQAPLYFDTSVKNLYPALKTGATVYLLPKKFFSFPLLLTRYLNEQEMTVAIWSTSAFHLVANSGVLEKEPPKTLRLIAVGGEALQAKQLNRWRRVLPDAAYFNHYGPTEVTVDCAYYPITRDFADDEPIPIGRACENMELLILRPDGTKAAPGEPGEICVRGLGLACGYYGDWDKTDAAFCQNPCNPHYPDRIYRTGDLGQWDAEGNVRFLSRQDDQIKHMGYRIELGEIETALAALQGIETAICFFDAARDFIVCVYQGTLEEAALATALRRKLPQYMVPNRFRRLESMPYNANGKIDRNQLKKDYFDGTN